MEEPCFPWYFPINDTSNARLCDPWEAREFKSHMSSLPYDACDDCMPDCVTTIYSTSVTAAPFRRCDYKNLGISFLCNFEEALKPPIWGQRVLDQYLSDIQQVPDYIDSLVSSNQRKFADSRATGKEIFKAANEKSPDYDAYEKDIAMVTFFFETSTVFEFSREKRMTLVQYISQMGGLLGLCMGFSFISAIEIVYWCVIRYARNL